MDEKEKAQEKEEAAKGQASEEASKDSSSKESGKSEDAKEEKRKSPIEEARELDASIKKGNAEMKKLVERNEQALGDARLEGKSIGGQGKISPKPLTDKEYAEALERGEVNPMKEDGYIK